MGEEIWHSEVIHAKVYIPDLPPGCQVNTSYLTFCKFFFNNVIEKLKSYYKV